MVKSTITLMMACAFMNLCVLAVDTPVHLSEGLVAGKAEIAKKTLLSKCFLAAKGLGAGAISALCGYILFECFESVYVLNLESPYKKCAALMGFAGIGVASWHATKSATACCAQSFKEMVS